MSDTPKPKKMFMSPFPKEHVQAQQPGVGSEQAVYGGVTQGSVVPGGNGEQGWSIEPNSDYSPAYHATDGKQSGDQAGSVPVTGNLPGGQSPVQGQSFYYPMPGGMGTQSVGNFPGQVSNQANGLPQARRVPHTRPLWPGQQSPSGFAPEMRGSPGSTIGPVGPGGNGSVPENLPSQLPFFPVPGGHSENPNPSNSFNYPNYPYNAVPVIMPGVGSPVEAMAGPSWPQGQPSVPPAIGAEDVQAERPARRQKRRFYRRMPGYRHFARLRTATQYSLKARILMVFLVFCLLAPLVVGVGEGINTYIIYSHARSGIQHLLNLRTIFLGGSDHTKGLLDVNKLKQARQELNGAHDDFVHLNDDLNQDMTVGAISAFLPKQIGTARALSQIGVDVTDMGQELVSKALILAPAIRSPLTNDPTQKGPLITQSMLDSLDEAITYALPRLNDIELQSHNLAIDSLPLINAHQRDQFKQIVDILPTARTDLEMAHNLKGALGWLLGVGTPRRFLVQTMDRAELRPTGGFTGQYGELELNGGRLSPFSLKDIGALEDFNANNPVAGNQAPDAYRSWWPFANWGLRDSNLSADFPTSAQLAINLYKFELNKQVDGVIYFSPFLISRVLQVIGPVQITKFQDTVTAQNLEERLHYYQLDNVGIRKIKILNHTPDAPDSDVRKLFTAEVARVLMDRIRHVPTDELITLGREMLHDLQTKDLQVYISNPQVQNLLTQYNASSQIDTFSKHDGFMVVQANVNATKASQYTRTSLHDTVTLDASGGATHVLQIRLAYNQNGPVYGMDTLRDYVRIYTPQSSQLLWGDGFEEPGFDAAGYYCGAGYGACPSPDVYQNGALLCPAGIDNAGVTPFLLNDPYSVKNHPFRNVGKPANTTSDMPGRGMFGGYIVVPKNCTATATVSWYVPAIEHGSYDLLVQRQASTLPELDLTLQTTPGSCGSYEKPGLHFEGVVGGPDMTFSLKMKTPANGEDTSCYIQPPV